LHIYEYLFTAIVIVTMLVAASVMVTTMPQPSLSVSAKEQLKTTTQRIMTQLILETGDPPDWGSNVSISAKDMKLFGLAKYTESTREAYVLDPDKVQRLSDQNPLYIPPGDVVGLLNINREYGLMLCFEPGVGVNVKPLAGGQYEISVYSNQNKLPIANAKVFAKMIYYNGSAFKVSDGLPEDSLVTDPSGRVRYTFNIFDGQPRDKVLVIVVDYFGVRFINTYFPNGTDYVRGYTIGNKVIFKEQQTFGNTNITQILVLRSDDRYDVKCVDSEILRENATFYNISYVEPSAVLLMLDQDGKLIIAWKDVPECYSSLPGAVSIPFAYSLERNVMIGGSSYTMRVQVWRMTW
jgi:hypothetical protein